HSFLVTDTATTVTYTLSLHDALPILWVCSGTYDIQPKLSQSFQKYENDQNLGKSLYLLSFILYKTWVGKGKLSCATSPVPSGAVSMCMWALLMSAMVCTIARPSPEPCWARPASPRRKRWPARAMSSADMPGPLSSTCSAARPSGVKTDTVMRACAGLYFMALFTMLVRAGCMSQPMP